MVYDNIDHWENIYSNQFNLYSSGYIELGESYNHWLYKLKIKAFKNALTKNDIILSKDSEVLDIGCGTGFWIREFQKWGVKKLIGFDLTKISIEKLSIRFPQYNFFQQDISEPLKQDNTFDFINIFDVLWYLDNTGFQKAFTNLVKLSKRGAYLFISDILREERCSQGEGFWPRSVSEYSFQCNKNGFEIICIYPLFVFTNTPCDPDSVNKRFFRFLTFHWKILFYLLTKCNLMGNVFGFPLFLLDSVATSFLVHGPSSKLMVLKRL